MACLLIKHASSKLLIVSVAVSSYYAVANSYITLAINKNNSRFTISNRTIQEMLLSLAALVSLLILGVLLKIPVKEGLPIKQRNPSHFT